MKAMLGVLKAPSRRAAIGFLVPRMASAAEVRDNSHHALTWPAAERWVKRVMWLLVLAITYWDLAATFGPHISLARQFHLN